MSRLSKARRLCVRIKGWEGKIGEASRARVVVVGGGGGDGGSSGGGGGWQFAKLGLHEWNT